MSIQLTGADVIDLAVQTEMRGERFYRQAFDKADGQEARDLFAYLADQEVEHKRVFQGLSSAIVLTEMDATAWDEALGYIAATVDQAFFTPDGAIQAVPLGETTADMLQQAIGFEKQTLLFFFELCDLVQAPNRPLIDRIIGEEKDHIRRLAAMLRYAS